MLRVFLAQQILKNMMADYNTVAEEINPPINVRGVTHMEIEDSPGLSSWSLNLSSVDIFLDKFEGTGSIDITKPMMLYGL